MYALKIIKAHGMLRLRSIGPCIHTCKHAVLCSHIKMSIVQCMVAFIVTQTEIYHLNQFSLYKAT